MNAVEALPAADQLVFHSWPDPYVDRYRVHPEGPYGRLTGSEQIIERGECPPGSGARGDAATVESQTYPAVVTVRAWIDSVVDRLGFPVRSIYVETVLVAVLGPSATLALRQLGTLAAAFPDGVSVDIPGLGAGLGLGVTAGRHSRVVRSLERLVAFEMARWQGDALAVRRTVAPLSQHRVRRLHPAVAALHHRLVGERP